MPIRPHPCALQPCSYFLDVPADFSGISTYIYLSTYLSMYLFLSGRECMTHSRLLQLHTWAWMKRDTLSDTVVSLRTVVTFVIWLISRTSFLVRNLFYDDIFVEVLLRGWDGERKSSRRSSLPNTSTFVPNDRSQYLYCVLPIIWCAFEAHLDVGLAERPAPCRFVENVHISFPRFREDGRLW